MRNEIEIIVEKGNVDVEVDKTVIQPMLQEKETTPTKQEQTITADSGYNGLSKVKVNPIPNEYIIPDGTIEITENGSSNVSEYATASVNVTPTLQEKSTTPTTSQQNITYDNNYDGLSNVVVNAIPSEYVIPSGTINITQNGTTNVSGYANANVNVSGGADLADYFTMTIQNGTSNSAGALQSIKSIPEGTKLAPAITSLAFAFRSCNALESVPIIDTSKVTTMGSMFYGCGSLKNVPCFDTSQVVSLANAFKNCYNLTNASLDNILKMCINATGTYTQTKTLVALGLDSNYYPASTIESLSNYQDFIDAGWTIGY